MFLFNKKKRKRSRRIHNLDSQRQF